MNPEYTKDENGKELLTITEKGDNIMMEWEKPYMEACIEKLNPSGDILEIGFGLGYSATAIQNYSGVKKHTIIDCSPEVWTKIEEFKKGHPTVELIKGRWEDVLRTLGKFDCIFFDDHPLNNAHSYSRWDEFAYNIFKNHTKVGSKISYYTTTSRNPCHILNDFVKYEFDNFKVDIPSNCTYVKSGRVFVPLLTVFKEQTKSINNLKNKNLVNETNRRNAERLIQKYKISESEILDNIVNKVPEFKPTVKKDVINTATTSPTPILLIIDNFYNNPNQTRRHILQQEFKIRGNYPGQRTISYATSEIRDMIQKWVYPFGGKITQFPMEKNDSNYNGAFQYTTSRDRSWFHVDSWNNWAGVLYLTPNAPVNSGTGLYKYKDGTRFEHEQKLRGNADEINKHTQDVTQWELVDKVGNIFNRLVIFNANSFHMSMDYFGHDKESGRLFQVFFFSTEKQVC
tara:strand:+ start:745 stop:2112 length:1368 start_codon:yes stop_codon:yes gene_type:complete